MLKNIMLSKKSHILFGAIYMTSGKGKMIGTDARSEFARSWEGRGLTAGEEQGEYLSWWLHNCVSFSKFIEMYT